MSIPEPVRVLAADLKAIFGGRLQSLVMYAVREPRGHGAHDTAVGHGHAAHAPLTHTLAIVDTMTAADLRACAERAGGWHDRGLATPLLVAGHELENSLDAFPLEFGAMIADHQLVSGRDPFAGAAVDPADVRRACEVQARSHLLHLREGFIETRGNADALAVLLVRSAAPFAALLESLARLQGLAARDREGIGRHIEHAIGMPGTITDVMKLAHVTEIPATEASRLFPAYLEAVEKLVAWVDGWKASR